MPPSLYRIRAACERKSRFTIKSGMSSRNIRTRTQKGSHSQMHMQSLQRMPPARVHLCAVLQVQKCRSCHCGALLRACSKKRGARTTSHSLVSCTSSSVSSCKAVILGLGLCLLEFLRFIGSSLRRSAWLMACLKELFSFSSF